MKKEAIKVVLNVIGAVGFITMAAGASGMDAENQLPAFCVAIAGCAMLGFYAYVRSECEKLHAW